MIVSENNKKEVKININKEEIGQGTFIIPKTKPIEGQNYLNPTWREKLKQFIYSKEYWIFYVIMLIICFFLVFWTIIKVNF
jgi:hypothetical protein